MYIFNIYNKCVHIKFFIDTSQKKTVIDIRFRELLHQKNVDGPFLIC